LEVLRYCLPPSVRRTLDELPETLDETYERVLKEIKKPNRDHARRVLQCLVVAIRPLRVEELAEVLAVNFDDEDGMPKLNPNWRWDDQEQALLSSCSSLIAIVNSGGSQIVQFSHFSVKEFLTSDRLAASSGHISLYHIDLQPAHTILAQASLSVLLRSDDRVEENGVRNSSPLTGYAAKHWVAHAQDAKVPSCLRKAMEYLFDVDKPYFASWVKLHDIDTKARYGSTFFLFAPNSKSSVTPLYYAARCGFQGLVEHLIVKNPEDVGAKCGNYGTPVIAALAAGQFQTAKILYENGADVDVAGYSRYTPLYSAVFEGNFEMVQVLLKYKADANVPNSMGWTPLHRASTGARDGPSNNPLCLSNVARLLLEHGADVNSRDNSQSTPLHVASRVGNVELVCMLLEHGADVGAEDCNGRTALQVVMDKRRDEVTKLLLEHGAR
jgi:ankyrin repeat protein